MSNMIELDALDTLFFRDGKPFSMGEDTWAESLFPPPPSVIYGALRTAYFSEDIARFEQIKKHDESTNLEIIAFSFKYGNRIYFPMPLDLIEVACQTKRGKEKKLCFLQQIENDKANFSSNLTTTNCLQAEANDFETIEDGILNARDLFKYLSLKHNSASCFDADYHSWNDFISSEPKVGIGLSKNTGTSKEGQLYRVGMQRLTQLSLVVGFRFAQLEHVPSMMRLGGEGKSVTCKSIAQVEIQQKINLPMPQFSGKRFKLYLATPALFINGWKPAWMTSEYSEHNGIKLRLLAAAVGKPIHIGGFDMQKQQPKAMKKAVPAGSVYYLELGNEADISKLEKTFHQQSISEIEDSKKQGFGITFVGGVS